MLLDSSNEDDDDYFEEDDNMFSRLEETRARLESELGCDTFLKAYKTVQVATPSYAHEYYRICPVAFV